MKKSALTLGLFLTQIGNLLLAQPITIEFAGEVTGSTIPERVAAGTPVHGTFTYDPRQGTQQSSTVPILSFDVGNVFSFRIPGFSIGIGDNVVPNNYPLPTLDQRPRDSLAIQFGYPPLLDAGAGVLRLSSFDTGIFTGTALPTTLPSIDRFDEDRTLNFHRDFGDITTGYWAVSARIDRLTVVPEPTAGLLLGCGCLAAFLWRAQRKRAAAKTA